MTDPFQSEPITLSKLEAARRQLRTAAELWFTNGDEVSTLALAYSSHEIIYRLYRNAGFDDLIYDSLLIKDEHRGDFARMLKDAPNFFKHADTGADEETITFRPGLSAMFLMMSGYALARMGEKLNDVELAMMFWFSLHFPGAEFMQSIQEKGLPINTLKTLTTRSRKEFFEACLQAIRRREASG